MDTATHLVIGVTLGGLAVTLDPTLTGSPTLNGAMMATIIGSQIPDIDTVTKLRNNSIYIRNHRGITHSIPAILLWTVLISGLIDIFYPRMEFLHLLGWTFLAVFFHVFTDIFNAYGTQALRPFSQKWLGLGVINTFDPILFIMHAVASICIINHFHVAFFSIGVFVLMFFYYLLRIYHRRYVISAVKKVLPHAEEIWASPSYSMRNYHIAAMTDTHYYVAKARKNQIDILDTFERTPIPENPIIEIAKQDENISAFLFFSKVYRWEMVEYDDYTEVRFIDLRYRTMKNHYPFVGIIHINKAKEIMESYTGWVFNEDSLQKKLK